MNPNKTNEPQMTYMSFAQTKNGFVFSVDGKEMYPNEFQKQIEHVVGYVTHFSYKPVIAKIEVLDKKEYFVMSLTLPIMPAFLDVVDPAEIELLANPNYMQLMKQRAKSLTNAETKTLIESRTNEYMNYIYHELAGAYISSCFKGKESVAKDIQNLPFMLKFDISNFNFSGAGRNVYKTPQFLKYKTEVAGEPQIRNYYMRLQENIPDEKKDDNFWSTVTQRDIAYVTLDESMNHTLAMLEQQYGEIDFMGTNTSLNYTDPAQKS
ncbi:MAG: hypothetical protein J6J33_01880 [Clostridia bacterium]|nr:hypothetical protein [Clostridia bacterium]